MNDALAHVPTLEAAGRLGRRPVADSLVADAYQTTPSPGDASLGSLLGSLGSAGLSLGAEVISLLQRQIFPSGAQLSMMQRNAGPNYTTYFDCAGYNYNGPCDEACFGFAPHHMDPFYCATCDEQAADPVNNPSWNWHFVGSRGQIQYQDREPDVCNGKDAWKWEVGACGRCNESAVFRCHDGYKKYPGNNYWDPTICQGLISCDHQLTTC